MRKVYFVILLSVHGSECVIMFISFVSPFTPEIKVNFFLNPVGMINMED